MVWLETQTAAGLGRAPGVENHYRTGIAPPTEAARRGQRELDDGRVAKKRTRAVLFYKARGHATRCLDSPQTRQRRQHLISQTHFPVTFPQHLTQVRRRTPSLPRTATSIRSNPTPFPVHLYQPSPDQPRPPTRRHHDQVPRVPQRHDRRSRLRHEEAGVLLAGLQPRLEEMYFVHLRQGGNAEVLRALRRRWAPGGREKVLRVQGHGLHQPDAHEARVRPAAQPKTLKVDLSAGDLSVLGVSRAGLDLLVVGWICRAGLEEEEEERGDGRCFPRRWASRGLRSAYCM